MPHMPPLKTRVLAILLGFILTLGALVGVPSRVEAALLSHPLLSHPLSLGLVSGAASSPQNEDSSSLLAQVPAIANNTRSFVADAVERVGPAVVRIDTERTITRNAPMDPFMNDPFFRRFFGDTPFPQGPYEERQQGQGSGFIISDDGLILTNAHVVDRADRVTVRLKDGRTLDGEVRGTDEVTDLAVVKISVRDGNLPVAPLGNSDDIKVGDWAIAVGNPLGLDNTVTLGIISTLNRSSAAVGIPDKRVDFIQTDAAINPGNSGGPLLNGQGEVIGINTAIRANAMGIGFAIPINKAKEISEQLAQGGHVAHPYIGVQIATLTTETAKQNNDDPNSTVMLPEVNGVLVVGVVPNAPAAQAGIRRGDVIIQINGQAVTRAEDLQNLVERAGLNQNLRVTIRRGDRTQQLSLRTAELQPES
ncbi:MAG TPA: HhoA/HhoB/HtrA family serine endopeptidase [Chroococcidiopsis sp.]